MIACSRMSLLRELCNKVHDPFLCFLDSAECKIVLS